MFPSLQGIPQYCLSNRHYADLYCVLVFNLHICKHNCSTKKTEDRNTLNRVGDRVISPGGGGGWGGGGISVLEPIDRRNGSASLSVSLCSSGLLKYKHLAPSSISCISRLELSHNMSPESKRAFVCVVGLRHSVRC